MRSPTDHTARLRGAATGAAAGAVAVLAHGLGGAPGLPDGSASTLLLAACALIGVVAAALPRGNGPAVTMVVLAVGQGVGHTALTLGHTQHAHSWSAVMLLAHLVAIPVGALAIRGAEVGVRRAITSVRRLGRALDGVPAPDRPRPALVATERALVRQLLRRPGIGLRGPPRDVLTRCHPVPA